MYLGFKHLGIAASVGRLNDRRSKIMGKRKKIMVMMKKKKEKKENNDDAEEEKE